jgi:hypothetical protein
VPAWPGGSSTSTTGASPIVTSTCRSCHSLNPTPAQFLTGSCSCLQFGSGNILLTAHGVPKIADFGLASAINPLRAALDVRCLGGLVYTMSRGRQREDGLGQPSRVTMTSVAEVMVPSEHVPHECLHRCLRACYEGVGPGDVAALLEATTSDSPVLRLGDRVHVVPDEHEGRCFRLEPASTDAVEGCLHALVVAVPDGMLAHADAPSLDLRPGDRIRLCRESNEGEWFRLIDGAGTHHHLLAMQLQETDTEGGKG